MRSDIMLYTILAFLVILTVVIIIAWTYTIKREPVFPPAPDYFKPGLGMRCSLLDIERGTNDPKTYQPSDCQFGLVCSEGRCYKDFGTSCTSIFDCLPGTKVCNGTCSLTNLAGLDDECDNGNICDETLVCDSELDNPVCKRDIGSEGCFNDIDCVADSICKSGVCQLPKEVAESCSFNNECSGSDICVSYGDASFCQNSNNPEPGELTSVCYSWNDTTIDQPDLPLRQVNDDDLDYPLNRDGFKFVPGCEEGLQCNANIIDGVINAFGKCGNADVWFDRCLQSNSCQYPQICIDGRCKFPQQIVDGKTVYNTLSCKNGVSTGVCLNDYKCDGENCVGENGNIPAYLPEHCVNGLSTDYSIVKHRFQKPGVDQTTRLSSASWEATNFVIPNITSAIDNKMVNFSSVEENNAETFLAILHVIGETSLTILIDNIVIPTVISSHIHTNVSITESGVLHTYDAKVSKVAFTGNGYYYCVIEYTHATSSVVGVVPASGVETFSIFYYSLSGEFNDVTLRLTPYTVTYYLGITPLTFRCGIMYSTSVDDRPIGSTPVGTDVRFFAVCKRLGEGTSPNTIDYDEGILISTRVINANIQTVIPVMNFDLLSYIGIGVNATGIDETIKWCQSGFTRTMNKTFPQKYCFAYRTGENKIVAYSPADFLTSFQSINAEVFPNITNSDLTFSQIGIYNSITKDINSTEAFYVADQGDNSEFEEAKYLGTSIYNQDEVLPAPLNDKTLISVANVAATLDVVDYVPAILLLTRTCT